MEKVGCTRQYESELSLRSFAQPFPSGDKGCTNRPTRCSNRYAIRLADQQRSTPAAELQIFVRDEPQGHTMLDACSMLMEPQGHTNRCLMLIARNLLGVLLMGTQGHNAGCGDDNTFYSTLDRIDSGEVHIRVMAEIL